MPLRRFLAVVLVGGAVGDGVAHRAATDDRQAGAPARTWTAKRGDPERRRPARQLAALRRAVPAAREVPHRDSRRPARRRRPRRSTRARARSKSRPTAIPPLAKFSAKFGVVESASPVLPVALRHVGADATLRGLDVTGRVAARAARSSRRTSRARSSRWLTRSRTADDTVFDLRDGGRRSRRPQTLALPAEQDPATTPKSSAFRSRVPACTSSRSSRSCSARRCSIRPARCTSRRVPSSPTSPVHFKWGGESSLVWVTTLDGAQPGGGRGRERRRLRRLDPRDGDHRRERHRPCRRSAESHPGPALRRDRWTEYTGGLLVMAKARRPSRHRAHELEEGIEPWRFGFRAGVARRSRPTRTRSSTARCCAQATPCT